jgi:hypothetical protein
MNYVCGTGRALNSIQEWTEIDTNSVPGLSQITFPERAMSILVQNSISVHRISTASLRLTRVHRPPLLCIVLLAPARQALHRL